MTFKHIKFEDSFTMRSLERIAKEKHLIANTIKNAKVEHRIDLSTSLNLTDNILKLCNGLKQVGMDKYADDLENNFLNYKKAHTLYETSKESGEDLINAAHPQGSHRINDIEGDAIIETIIDQHLAHLKMIEKKPTGKLSSSQIINQVKLAMNVPMIKLAIPTNEQISIYNLILDKTITLLNNLVQKLKTAPPEQVGLNWNDPLTTANKLSRWINVLNNAVKSGIATGNTKALQSALENIKKTREDVQIFNKDHQDANKIAAGMVDNVVSNLEKISWSIQHPDYTPPIEEYKGSTFSKIQPGHHWESKYVMKEEPSKTGVTTAYLDTNLLDLKSTLNYYASKIQQDVLDKEDAIYQPVPDTNIARINILDRAFDRAENLRNQLSGLGAILKGVVVDGKERITGTQLAQVANKFSMFKGQQFNSKDDLVNYINRIQKSIYDAIGIK